MTGMTATFDGHPPVPISTISFNRSPMVTAPGLPFELGPKWIEFTINENPFSSLSEIEYERLNVELSGGPGLVKRGHARLTYWRTEQKLKKPVRASLTFLFHEEIA